MCNIFIAVSTNEPLDIQRCLKAMNAAKSRGPDFRYYNTPTSNIFLGCDVLSIVGNKTNKKYYAKNNIELYYNGEIYNIDLKSNISDTEALVQLFDKDDNILSTLKKLDGMFGLVIYDKNKNLLYCARDVIGEKTLYVYHTDKLHIISSTLSSILSFVTDLDLNYDILNRYLHTRHLLTYNQTVYKNIYQIPPGVCETYDIKTNTKVRNTYESLSDYITETDDCEQDLIGQLDYLLDVNIKQMLSDKKIATSFSGGIDSSLIAWYIAQHTDNLNLFGTNCVGKDYISNNLKEFNEIFGSINIINIYEKEWFLNLEKAYKILCTPLPSHSFLTQLILTQHLKNKNIQVCYNGVGADELFGGYNAYNTDIANKNVSPYSTINKIPINHVYNPKDLESDLSQPWEYAYSATKSNILAMSYADTVIELIDDGLRNSDQISGWYGIESRSPFVRKDILKFAFSLPERYKRGKPLLKALFKQKFPNITIKKKQGYAGFPNETKRFIKTPFKKFPIVNILNLNSFKYTKQVKWKLINLHLFYESYYSGYSRFTP